MSDDAHMSPARYAIQTILRAVARARIPILSIALTYAVFLIIGAVMVHAGNGFALARRDNLIRTARDTDPSSLALDAGQRWRAALLDFSRNLVLGAVPDTLGGLGVVFPYPFVAYRGWVGGIVSVNDQHASRLARADSAIYYIVTLILQLIPYSLAGGAGVNLGLSLYRRRPAYQGEKVLGVSKEALRDVARIYVLVIPLFFVASLWEFLLAS